MIIRVRGWIVRAVHSEDGFAKRVANKGGRGVAELLISQWAHDLLYI